MRHAAARTGRTATTIVVAAIAIALGACGPDSEETRGGTTVTAAEPALTRAELAVIDQTEKAIDRYCLDVAAAVSRGSAPTTAQFNRIAAEIDRLAALARERPDATGPDGSSARLALGDIAEFLEGSNCDSRLVTRIDEALAAIEGTGPG